MFDYSSFELYMIWTNLLHSYLQILFLVIKIKNELTKINN